MSQEAKRVYHEQLRARQAGAESTAGPNTPFIDVKPHFYADARLIIKGVRGTYQNYRVTHPPYGLVSPSGDAIAHPVKGPRKNWIELERAMASTARAAFAETTIAASSCPYSEALGNLGPGPLTPDAELADGLDRLKEVTFPGAKFAPATIVNLLRRIPAMAAMNQATIGLEELARNSDRSLLHEPLHHPQQYAKAFTFCLGDGYRGTDLTIDRETFMPEEVIAAYTHLSHDHLGKEVIGWSIPTLDFTLRAAVSVANRQLGPEYKRGAHLVEYPAGTRLGDIQTDEPTIGCPGDQMAYQMWRQAIDVIVGEDLWNRSEER